MNWSELARTIKEHGNEKVKTAFADFLKERLKESKQWAKKTKSEEMAFLLESLAAGYGKALRALNEK